ncbi:MAG: threonine-phosphate decarboxylase CobD [Rhizobiaceae bacterium]|nr:threonine-phosphate decarboxylase CobD [Rhizobiaceae bacterium]
MARVFHGGRLDEAMAKYGGKREDWLDLSTGINPNPYPLPDIPLHAWSRLPDTEAEQELNEAARAYYEVPDGFEIVAAPGTQAIIEVLPRLLDIEFVSILSPTYGEHKHAWEKARAKVAEISDLDDLQSGAQACVVVNPNNPTGNICCVTDLVASSDRVENLIVDEAFADPSSEVSVVPCIQKNMIVLKSFGKFFGLAGLRLGFAICTAALAKRIREMIGPWAVSGPALHVGAAAMQDRSWIANTIRRLESDSDELCKLLKNNGFSVESRNPLFVSAFHQKAHEVFECLAREQILVRPFPDRKGYLRFGLCKDQAELDRLAKALRAFPNV